MSEGEHADNVGRKERHLDSAWVHGRMVNEGDYRKVQCIYCSQVITNTITGLKKHLARVGGTVRACPRVPKPVKDGFRKNFEKVHPTYTWTLKRKQKDVPLYLDHSHNPKNVNTSDEMAENEGSLLANKVAGLAKKNAGTAKRDDDVIRMCTSSTQGAPKEGRVTNTYDPKQNSPDRSKMSLQKLFSRMCKDSATISRRLEFEALINNEMNTDDVVKHAEEIVSIRNDVLKIKSEATQLANRWSTICDKSKK